MDEVVKNKIRFVPVKRIDTVLETAVNYMPRPTCKDGVVHSADNAVQHAKAPELYQ